MPQVAKGRRSITSYCVVPVYYLTMTQHTKQIIVVSFGFNRTYRIVAVLNWIYLSNLYLQLI